ncbi:MAG: hypothetical protein O7B25_12920 [Gammaproteobacteria bacterium]|nr:hypothetical protein [Gammaproteobacteria bacterium]
MTIRRESAAPAGAPFVGVNQLLYNEADGGLYVKLPDGQVRRVNVPPSDARVSSGDARGADAVDFQYTRDRVDQVASGARASIPGGRRNRASGVDSVVLGGEGNTAEGDRNGVGGYQNATGALQTFTWGSNNAMAGDDSVGFGRQVWMGPSVKASSYVKSTKTFTRDAATQVGTISTSHFGNEVMIYSPDFEICRIVDVLSQDYLGTGTVVFEGDLSDIEDDMEGSPSAFTMVMLKGGAQFSMGVGEDVQILANGGFAAGENLLVKDKFARAFGRHAVARLWGLEAKASGRFAADGDGQRCELTVFVKTTDATPTQMGLWGASGAGFVVLEDDTFYAFRATVIAKNEGADENAVYFLEGAIKRGTGVGSVALVGVVTLTVHHEDVAAWTVLAQADTTNGALEFKATGEAGKTIRWMCSVDWVEVAV